jgi:hypothetical protein
VATPTLNFNMVNGNLNLLQGPFSTSVNISPSLALLGNTLTVANSSISLPGLNLWARPTATATNLFNTTDNVGIGTINPLQKLDLIGYFRVGAGNTSADEGWLLFTPSPGLSILRAGGRATTEMRLDQSNNAPMTMWTAGTERMRVTQTGNVGIGIAAPLTKLHVNGQITVADGSQGAGRVLVSDAAGTASWQPVSLITTGNVACQSIPTVSNTPVAFPTVLLNFNKAYSDTKVEVILQTDLNVQDFIGCNSVRYEIRMNGNPPPNNTGRATYYIDNNGSIDVTKSHGATIIAEFTGLPAGAYSVQLYASAPFSGSANSVFIDMGCFGASSIIAKEYK